MFLFQLFVIGIAGFLDRVRGGWPQGREKVVKYVALFFIGVLMASVFTFNLGALVACGVGVALISWRQDNGWRGGFVQGVGVWWKPLKWGLQWSIPLVFLAPVEPKLALYLLAGPLGAWLAIHIAIHLPAFPKVLDLRHGWPWSELIEMPVIGLLAVGLGWLVPQFAPWGAV